MKGKKILSNSLKPERWYIQRAHLRGKHFPPYFLSEPLFLDRDLIIHETFSPRKKGEKRKIVYIRLESSTPYHRPLYIIDYTSSTGIFLRAKNCRNLIFTLLGCLFTKPLRRGKRRKSGKFFT